MRVEIRKTGEKYLFEGINATGNKVMMDCPSSIKPMEGASPMELLLMAIAGCSGIDILGILDKMNEKPIDFQIIVSAEKEKQDFASVFGSIHVQYNFHGTVDPVKIQKAINLSLDKYCSVAKMLEKTATITSSFTINS